MQQEEMEAENRRIAEFANSQEHREESRMAKMKEREEAKEHLLQLVRDATLKNALHVLPVTSLL